MKQPETVLGSFMRIPICKKNYFHHLGWWKPATLCASVVTHHGFAHQAIASCQAGTPHYTAPGETYSFSLGHNSSLYCLTPLQVG